MPAPFVSPGHILWVRPDAIGDNVLSSSMLPHIRQAFPAAKLSVFCQEHIAELYQACPFVDEIITFNVGRFERDEEYRQAIFAGLGTRGIDLCLNSVYSRTALSDFVVQGTRAARKVAFVGGLENMSAPVREQHNRQVYTDLLPNEETHLPELQRHRAFLRGLGIEAASLEPMVWVTEDDDRYAEEFFRSNALDPRRTVALFAGAGTGVRQYDHYGAGLGPVCREQSLSVIALGAPQDAAANQTSLAACDGVRTIDLTGKTSLCQGAAILSRCRLAVGAETGLGHIACAVGTPNVILLGGGHIGRFMPYAATTSAVSLPLDCHGCNWACRFATVHCVRDIEPRLIEAAVRATLANASPRPRVFVPAPATWPDRRGLPVWRWPEEKLSSDSVEIVSVDTRRDLRAGADPSAGDGVPAPSALAGYARTLELVKVGQTDQALAVLERLMDNERLCAQVRNDAGAIRYQQGHTREAVVHFERAVLLDPTHVTAHLNLADVYLEIGRRADAVALLEHLLALDPADGEIAARLRALTAGVKTSAA